MPLSPTGEEDDPDIGIDFNLVQGRVEVRHELPAERVGTIGPIDREIGERFALLEDKGLKGRHSFGFPFLLWS